MHNLDFILIVSDSSYSYITFKHRSADILSRSIELSLLLKINHNFGIRIRILICLGRIHTRSGNVFYRAGSRAAVEVAEGLFQESPQMPRRPFPGLQQHTLEVDGQPVATHRFHEQTQRLDVYPRDESLAEAVAKPADEQRELSFLLELHPIYLVSARLDILFVALEVAQNEVQQACLEPELVDNFAEERHGKKVVMSIFVDQLRRASHDLSGHCPVVAEPNFVAGSGYLH